MTRAPWGRVGLAALWLLAIQSMATAAPQGAALASHGGSATPAATQPDPQSDTPPPSAYDLSGERERLLSTPASNMMSHLWRMILALAAVVGLILFCGKLLLPRLNGPWQKSGGKHVRLLERVGVDAKNALLLVELSPQQERILLSAGEGGVRFVCNVSDAHHAAFQDSMAAADVLPNQATLSNPSAPAVPMAKERDARAS